MSKLIVFLLGAALLIAVSQVRGENVVNVDGYTIHYNVFNANLLDDKVATAYKLRNGCGDGVLTVAVRKKDDGAVAARVRATSMTLVGQRNSITMNEVVEGRSIYYVGTFLLSAGDEPLKFILRVRPEEGTENSFEFTRQLFHC